MAHSTRRTLTAAIVAASVSLGALVAACSDSGEEVTVDSSTTETTTTTTSTTTTEPTTTERTPTTLDDEAAIRDVHTRFMTEIVAVDTRGMSLDQQMAAYEGIAVDPLLTRTRESRSKMEELDQYGISPGYLSNVVDISVQGTTATVTDCSLGRGVLYDSDGQVLIPADDTYKLRESRFVNVDGQWLIADLLTGGNEECDPNE